MIHALVALCFLCSSHDKAYDASRVALYSGAAFDLTTTVAIKGHEADPVATQAPVAQVAIIGGLVVISDSLTRDLKKRGHTKAATVINFVSGSVHFAAGTWNIKNGPYRANP